ncbi:hypothetical protein IW261DRAFT_35394 [Armillaria novae-zelandiae]|uniref:Secreted protein n=1 Tax=Armillaria novae-zelandiae TaxID=153914 RepID=A0AA39PUE9_9AGAR|nr:hypothetical protein IW261DRAFT_35394 [Armillaria novae-zelandiae]
MMNTSLLSMWLAKLACTIVSENASNCGSRTRLPSETTIKRIVGSVSDRGRVRAGPNQKAKSTATYKVNGRQASKPVGDA